MTTPSSVKKKIKVTERETPYDIKMRDSIDRNTEKTEKTPRKSTPGEQYANNNAESEHTKNLFSVENWIPIFRKELKDMNRNKIGRPFDFCDSQIYWIVSFMTLASLTFREAAGAAVGILKSFGFSSPSYSRLHERAAKLAESMVSKICSGENILVIHSLEPYSDGIRNVGIDSSGFNLSDTTLWRSKKWKSAVKDRGWLKLHALADVETNEIIAYAITTVKVGDSPMLKPLLEAALSKGHRIGKLYADGAYASRSNFKFVCEENGLEFITSFRRNTVPKNRGCQSWGDAAKLWCRMRYKDWVEFTGYGKRWKIEVVFSDIKRILTETLTGKSEKGSVRQLILKIDVYNRYKRLRFSMIQNH